MNFVDSPNAQINLDSGVFCREEISSRSKYSDLAERRCHLPMNHKGKCAELPFLHHLGQVAPKVAKKIERDSIMTTGASWKSKEAGPNRILRWVMLESDDKLSTFGIHMSRLKPQVVAKLREKAADYDSCIRVAMWLTYEIYKMPDSPDVPKHIRDYLEPLFGSIVPNSTTCTICRLPLSFSLFAAARRGKAEIETCHKDPRLHQPDNVGFAHRACNIAQGPKTLNEFYDWIEQILRRARPGVFS
ncbi:MAG TPA: hypothetical protein DIU00_12815 [Phycisphaerales bacterium]|nr:hypothetical protein [Phycisphaerales bacterium]